MQADCPLGGSFIIEKDVRPPPQTLTGMLSLLLSLFQYCKWRLYSLTKLAYPSVLGADTRILYFLYVFRYFRVVLVRGGGESSTRHYLYFSIKL